MNEFYQRVAKPMMLPLIAGAFIFVLVWAFSRILLAVPEAGSTALALLLSAEILGVGAVIAAAAKLKAAQRAISIFIGLALVAGGGVAAGIGERDFGHHEGAEHSITAEGIVFLESEIELPADEPFELEFVNHDAGVPHNVAIYTDATLSDALFIGEIFNGDETRIYEVPALASGSYFFQCDVHPDTMTGTAIVGEGGTPPSPDPTASPPDGDAPTSVDITAKGIQFDTDAVTLAADKPVTIDFQNDDNAIEHNVAIYTDSSQREEIFKGETFFGVDSRTYRIPATPAGEYFFVCTIHPNMTGTIVFR